MPDRTKVLSVHRLRRTARRRQRGIQTGLDHMRSSGVSVELNSEGEFRAPWGILLRPSDPPPAQMPMLPGWTHGVRVEKAGPFQHAVVATEHRGH